MSLRSNFKPLVRLALAEDIGTGDVTTRYFCDPKRKCTARIITREACVLAGMDVVRETFRQVDPAVKLRFLHRDGACLRKCAAVLEARGRAASILTAERVALNFIQRLSGVATMTRAFADAIQGTRAKILDTRKTTPGLRSLEKAAVIAGGGMNHRIGLYDMALVKDNHLASAAGDLQFLQRAITRLKSARPRTKIEIEADKLEQVEQFLTLRGVDRILLDNMTPAQMRAAVKMSKGRVEMEASGGIHLGTVRKIAQSGVDYISVGALTHSARAIDFSLEFEA